MNSINKWSRGIIFRRKMNCPLGTENPAFISISSLKDTPSKSKEPGTERGSRSRPSSSRKTNSAFKRDSGYFDSNSNASVLERMYTMNSMMQSAVDIRLIKLCKTCTREDHATPTPSPLPISTNDSWTTWWSEAKTLKELCRCPKKDRASKTKSRTDRWLSRPWVKAGARQVITD